MQDNDTKTTSTEENDSYEIICNLQNTRWFSNNPNKDVTAVNRAAKHTQKENYSHRPHPKEVWTWASKHRFYYNSKK